MSESAPPLSGPHRTQMHECNTSVFVVPGWLAVCDAVQPQVPIAQKCVRVLVHLNEICTKFLHEFVGDESMEQDEEVKRQVPSFFELGRGST